MSATRTLGPAAWVAPASVIARLTIQASGTSVGNLPIDVPAAQINFSCLAITPIDLASGNNTINVPVSSSDLKATAVIIVPPDGNTVAYTVRASGDTGIPENPLWPFVIKSFSTLAPPTTIQINAAAAISGMLLIWM